MVVSITKVKVRPVHVDTIYSNLKVWAKGEATLSPRPDGHFQDQFKDKLATATGLAYEESPYVTYRGGETFTIECPKDEYGQVLARLKALVKRANDGAQESRATAAKRAEATHKAATELANEDGGHQAELDAMTQEMLGDDIVGDEEGT